MSQKPTAVPNHTKTQCANIKFHCDVTDVSLENTTSSNTITPEMLEKLYASSKTGAGGRLSQKYSIPTPVAILGLCVALTPLSIELMGWRGASGFPATK